MHPDASHLPPGLYILIVLFLLHSLYVFYTHRVFGKKIEYERNKNFMSAGEEDDKGDNEDVASELVVDLEDLEMLEEREGDFCRCRYRYIIPYRIS